MAEKNQINSPRLGMNMDTAPQDLKETQYPYALNAVITGVGEDLQLAVVQNESSNRLAVKFPNNFRVVGLTAIPEQNRTLFALLNTQTGSSQIGEVLNCLFDDYDNDEASFMACDTCTYPILREDEPLEKTAQSAYCHYKTVVAADCLGFSIDFPVRFRYKILDNQLNVYFTDNNKQRRFLYFDYDSSGYLKLQDRFKVVTGFDANNCDQPVYGTSLDCNKCVYHPRYTIPCIKGIHDVAGGSLKAGAYQFFLAYTDKEGNPLTNYFPGTNPFPIFTKPQTFETNYSTDRAIKFSVSDLDTGLLYPYYTVVVAETVDNFTVFKQVGTFPITQETVTYTGKTEKDLTENDVFFRTSFYNKAAGIAVANKHLLFSNLSSWGRPNLQRAANRVRLYWQTVAAPEPVYHDPRFSVRFRGYQRDEVYSFGLVFVTKEGEELGTYHVPGPSKSYLEGKYSIDLDQVVDNDDVIKEDECFDGNCCGDGSSGNTQLTGTITATCTDNGCTKQGLTKLTFTFPQPTTKQYTLYLGHIITYPLNGNQKVGQGYSIYELPNDVTPYIYYDNPASPFVVTVPAGTTSFSVDDIIIQQYTHASASHWVCHSCQFPVTDIYVKVAEAGIDANFTTSDSWSVHNVPGDTVEDSPEDCIDCQDALWKIYNTAQVAETPHEVMDSCDDDGKVWEWGDFAYWESTERYPNVPEVWGELCGQPIRHVKFPDSLVTHIHDSKDGVKGFQDSNIVFPIGVSVDHQSVIDALDYCVNNGIIHSSDRERIAGYRLVRGNRVGNKSIVAKGLLFDMWKYSKWDRDYYYPNYPYNDLRPDYFLAPNSNTYNGSNTSDPTPSSFVQAGRYTFHSPDTHFNNPQLGTRLKLEALEYGQSEGYFNHCDEQAKYKFLSTTALSLALAAGIAAAFSATTEKECVTYTTKGPTEVDAKNGLAPYPNVYGYFAPSAAGTGGGGWINTTAATTTFNQGDQTYDWNNQNFRPFNRNTGAEEAQIQVDEVTRTTCKGTPYQILGSTGVGGMILTLLTGVSQGMYLSMLALKEMQIIVDLIESLVPLKNFAIQYNSVGKYVNFKDVLNNGNKQRAILRGVYLDPKIQLVNEPADIVAGNYTNTYVNNWNRESSVYLKIDDDKLLPNPAVADQSRGTMDNFFADGMGLQPKTYYNYLNKRVYADISGYYASIKNFVPDQWGSIANIEYLPTGTCDFLLSRSYTLGQTSVFGGDTFITRFAVKRKMPFFSQTRFRAVDEADVNYKELGNAAFPNYFITSKQPLMERLQDINLELSLSSIGNAYQRLIGVAHSRLDARTDKFFYQNGYMHLYNYGIPYFFVESDVNCDYRHAENSREKDFYPHQKDLDYWLQEKNVPITEDNYFFYNRTYSKQNKEAVIGPQVMKLDDTEARDRSSVIQSEQEQFRPDIDKWLQFKANNKYRFEPSAGPVIGLDGIENDKVLVRFENGSQIFGAYQTLQTDSNTIMVGNGGIFNSPMKEFSRTTLGHAGSQHAEMLSTEFGHIWVDAKRGNVFLLTPNAQGMDELTKDGMRAWFQKNLKFQLKKDFPNIPAEDLDNHFKGVGITLGYDKVNARLLLTKLDYRRLDTGVVYDKTTRKFYKGNVEVSLDDPAYFCSKSWTVSYSFLTKSWVSFHSYTPHFYVNFVDFFHGGDNGEGKLWSHNVTARSFQVFNGKLQPFKVEIVATPMLANGILNSVSFITDARRFQADGDFAINKYITFNKAVIYNDQQSTGPLNLHVRDENNLADAIRYPYTLGDEQHILVTNLKNIWHFNQFWDTVAMQPNNQPLMVNNCAHSDKLINLKPLNLYKPDMLKQRLEGKNTRIRLIQDQYSNYNILFTLVKTQVTG